MKDTSKIVEVAKGRCLALFTFKKRESSVYYKHLNNFLNKLFEGLDDMLNHIIDNGNFSFDFETEYGVLGSYEQVGKDLCRMARPFQFELEVDIALKSLSGIPDNLLETFSAAKGRIKDIYMYSLANLLSLKKDSDIKVQKDNVLRKVNDTVIVNMTEEPIEPKMIDKFCKGKKWIKEQKYKSDKDQPVGMSLDEVFQRKELENVLNSMYHWGDKQEVNLLRSCPKLEKDKIFTWNNLEADIVEFSKTPGLFESDLIFLNNILDFLESCVISFGLAEDTKEFKTPPDKILVEADKSQGVVLMYIVDLLDMYDRNNQEHNYVKTNITEVDLVADNLSMRDFLAGMLPKEVKDNLSPKLKTWLNRPFGMAPIMRPLIKLQKLENPGPKDRKIVKARMVKSSSGAPLNVIAEIMSDLTVPMIDKLNSDIKHKFGDKPAVKDCVEVFETLTSKNIQNIDSFCMGFEYDAENMYLQLDHCIIKEDYAEILDYFEKKKDFKDFYLRALEVLMTHNHFRQPGGIYTVGPMGSQGFSIGCFFASNGSEGAMVWREGKLLMALHKRDLLKYVKVNKRYKDDGIVLIEWHPTKTLEVIVLLCETFPQSLKLKFKCSPVKIDFVDQSLYINNFNKDSKKWQSHVTLLRKKEASYDIPRFGTNMKDSVVFGTLHSYIRRAEERNSLEQDKVNNHNLYKIIVKHRGFRKNDYKKVKKIVLDRKSGKVEKKPKWDSGGKKFPGKITFDRRSNCHKKIINVLKSCKLPDRFSPPLPNHCNSVWQEEFKKKKFMGGLDKYVEKVNRSKELNSYKFNKVLKGLNTTVSNMGINYPIEKYVKIKVDNGNVEQLSIDYSGNDNGFKQLSSESTRIDDQFKQLSIESRITCEEVLEFQD